MKANVKPNIAASRAQSVGIFRTHLPGQDWRDIRNHKETWLTRHLRREIRDFLIRAILRYSKICAFAYRVLHARETTWVLPTVNESKALGVRA